MDEAAQSLLRPVRLSCKGSSTIHLAREQNASTLKLSYILVIGRALMPEVGMVPVRKKR